MKPPKLALLLLNLAVIAAASVAMAPQSLRAAAPHVDGCENKECDGTSLCRSYTGYQCFRNNLETACENKKCGGTEE
jgi:hypothetical protein